MRLTLVSLVVLAWAGWGTPALGQGAPANAHAVFAGGAGAEPDTTAPWRYYPLAVGNVWEYEDDDGLLKRSEVVKDTTALGRRYFIVHNALAQGGRMISVFRDIVRFDTASATVRQLLPSPPAEERDYLKCQLDAPFGETVPCVNFSEAEVTGGYDEPVALGEDLPGTEPDTVRTAVKLYVYVGIGFGDQYAAGIGLVRTGGDGFDRQLAYYRVNGVERGVSRFPTPTAPTPPASGAALAVGPNPTGGAATVRLDLPAPAEVRVAVYDVLGRRVGTLASGALAAGTHRLPFDAAPLAPGVYVVRAEVGGGAVLVRRVTVAR